MNSSFHFVLHDLALHDQSELVRRDSLLFHQRLFEIGDLRSNDDPLHSPYREIAVQIEIALQESQRDERTYLPSRDGLDVIKQH